MSRKPNNAARRAEIVEALMRVMSRRGYEKATVQAIAEDAGLAPGLIHYHFKNKQEILVSLVQFIADFSQARFIESARDAENAFARLHAYLHSKLGLGAGAAPELVAAWVMIGAEAVRQPEVRELYQKAVSAELALLQQLLAECLAEQGRDDGGAGRLAAALIAMMEGAFQLSSAAGTVMPSGYAAHAAIEFARLSIDAAPAA